MAVYFDHRCQAPFPGQNTDLQWHRTHPILAVASFSEANGANITCYGEEGEHMQDSVIRKSRPASAIQWHPTKRILAIGWETGEVNITNEQDHELYEVPLLHKAEITILQWSSAGSRLVTGDSSGLLLVWKTDSRGRVQSTPLMQHVLEEQLTQIVLRPPPPVDPTNDIASLARAAVSGDESALDMFNWQVKKGVKPPLHITAASLGPQEAMCFFIGGANGNVYYLNETGKIVIQFTAEGCVRKLLYYDDRNILITVTSSMMLTQHNVTADGDTREILKVKLSGRSDHPDVIWAGKGLLATCTGESVIRMWDLDKEENFILNLEGHSSFDRMEILTCVAFCSTKAVLAAGTGAGHVALWKYSSMNAGVKQEPEDKWSLQPASTVDGPVSDLAWGSSKNLLAVNTVDEVFILSEQVMSCHCREGTAVIQTGPMQLSVDVFSTLNHHDLKTDVKIKGVYNTKEAVAIWDGRKVVIYEVSGENSIIRAAGTFSSETSLVCLYEQNAYTLEPGKVQVRNFQGTVKQLLNFSEAEGEPSCMQVCSNFLVVGTTTCVIKIFDLSRRSAKVLYAPRSFKDHIPNLAGFVSAKCNCVGNKVSLVCTLNNSLTDPKIYVWDIDFDTLQYFNFETGRAEQDDYTASTKDQSEKDVSDASKDTAGRYPLSHFWDHEEPKLLVCEAQVLPPDQLKAAPSAVPDHNKNVSLTKATMEETVEVLVVSLFVSVENGVLIQDSFALSSQHSSLLGLEAPYFFFSKKADQMNKEIREEENFVIEQNCTDMPSQSMVSRKIMRDFVGLEGADKMAKDAMMNFSFYLTIGNMDEAFKAIKLIKSESVWENMAKMCVKTRRLDVAMVCLGNMSHARGAKALRESATEAELDARVAVLAMQLGLHEDAERLLKNCKRYDYLNEFYQASCQWGKAMETAEMYDRVHVRTTYYNYAKHLEAKGDIQGAIPLYEKSDTHRFEVPRMLFDEQRQLESYIMNTKDKTLRKWWAQYMESTGEMEPALQFYEAGQDYLSLVRVYCYCGNIEKAAEICNETGEKAACYHLARQYENSDQIKESIHFFTRAGAYGNAMRLCREHGFEDQLMNLALLSKPEDMVDAARYYEFKPGCQDKAVMLYHKAGYFSKALDLAFTTKQYAALQMISEDLNEKTDPELLQRCADFFTENSQFDRAVDLLAMGRKFWDALKICMEQHVPMTEELVEKLTPGKELVENDVEERNKILEGIAEVCMQQRQYHLATKKYTQAGNKVKAMKALLKSGDTEKITFFAGVSRQKEIYVMAANYLQSLDWRKDPEIMKNIIGFYNKGRALDSLSSFYDACAQVEIDEYQNYEKALGALGEAYKCLGKAKMTNQSMQEEKLAQLKRRVGFIKKFSDAQKIYRQDAEEAMKICQVLLSESNIDSAVRLGDIYGLMVEHFASRQKWKAAQNAIEDLATRIPSANITYYINRNTLQTVYSSLDLQIPDFARGKAPNGFHLANGEEEDGEVVEEDVVDEA
ncbi:hypothetical protein CAPTEDRAFT_114177 [Capitella teleta]|uniref:Uncharacterized protein n=1 Tax=Capitella teleta TaxID=283909 RepID=R7TK43_CAPTE|nr:hypothetical protein CAPTEDRAFT_114177 [Capitella teleta]|eukprot:ELT94193.1 hypothetical protein CAPTEDRAFT_114177 [Capitella teleta]